MECSYDMEELIPIVKELSEKYTGKASSSITYEKAQQLMSAVLYCIHEFELCDKSKEYELLYKGSSLQAKKAYEIGYQLVEEKVKQTHKIYNKMILSFHSYGNIAYKETIEKGIPSFFQWYDPKMEPQNHIILVDYPCLISFSDLQGVDYMYEYISCIQLEQKFLSKFSETDVKEILYNYHLGYEELIINICSAAVRKILVSMFLDLEAFQEKLDSTDYTKLENALKILDKESLKKELLKLLHILIKTMYEDERKLFDYLKSDLDNFAAELFNAAKYNTLKNLV